MDTAEEPEILVGSPMLASAVVAGRKHALKHSRFWAVNPRPEISPQEEIRLFYYKMYLLHEILYRQIHIFIWRQSIFGVVEGFVVIEASVTDNWDIFAGAHTPLHGEINKWVIMS